MHRRSTTLVVLAVGMGCHLRNDHHSDVELAAWQGPLACAELGYELSLQGRDRILRDGKRMPPGTRLVESVADNTVTYTVEWGLEYPEPLQLVADDGRLDTAIGTAWTAFCRRLPDGFTSKRDVQLFVRTIELPHSVLFADLASVWFGRKTSTANARAFAEIEKSPGAYGSEAAVLVLKLAEQSTLDRMPSVLERLAEVTRTQPRVPGVSWWDESARWANFLVTYCSTLRHPLDLLAIPHVRAPEIEDMLDCYQHALASFDIEYSVSVLAYMAASLDAAEQLGSDHEVTQVMLAELVRAAHAIPSMGRPFRDGLTPFYQQVLTWSRTTIRTQAPSFYDAMLRQFPNAHSSMQELRFLMG